MIPGRVFAGAVATMVLLSGPWVSEFAQMVGRAQENERLMLGIMRRDGVILPFAAYHGEWSLPWPGSIRTLELPITLDDVPKKWWGPFSAEMPRAWTLWTSAAQAPVRVTGSAPIAVLVGHEKRLGVRTDYKSAEPRPLPSEFPYPKDGLAVAGDVKVESIASVSKRATAAWRELESSVQEDIEVAEQRAIQRIKSNGRWDHPYSRVFRQGTPIEVEAWYTSTLEQPGFVLSYIEAAKKYPPGGEDRGCGLQTFVSGWIHINSRQPKPRTDLTARITYCDREGVSYMLPLGRIRVKSRTHWVFQMSGWDHEWYEVLEATPGRVRFVAEFFAGARPPM